MVIRDLDPRDDQALRRWHAAYLEAETHERPFATPWMFEEVRAAALAPPVAVERLLLAALVDDEVVATAQALLPLKDNVTRADLMVHTVPSHRRRGHATALLDHLEELLAARGRRVLTVVTDHAFDLGPTGAGDPGVELLRRRGYEHALGDLQQTLELPADAEELASLAEVPAPYRLVTVTGALPDALLPSYCRLAGTLVVEAPTGDLVQEPELVDEERVRAEEQQLRDGGRTRYRTLALDAAGEVAGFTEVDVPRHDPGRAYQQGTLVDPAHRGHRLGAAVKAANLVALQQGEPGVRTVITYNAEVNRHMRRVNELLGFRPTARLAELQKRLR